MMLGSYEMDTFRNFNGIWTWLFALMMFIVFMLVVPIVMMNALIAIMGATFEAVAEQKSSSMTSERAKLILELESTLLKPDINSRQAEYSLSCGARPSSWISNANSALRMITGVMLTRKKGHPSLPVEYLHVLKQDDTVDKDMKRKAGKSFEHVQHMVDNLSDRLDALADGLGNTVEQRLAKALEAWSTDSFTPQDAKSNTRLQNTQ